jgi:hypothetical protein
MLLKAPKVSDNDVDAFIYHLHSDYPEAYANGSGMPYIEVLDIVKKYSPARKGILTRKTLQTIAE